MLPHLSFRKHFLPSDFRCSAGVVASVACESGFLMASCRLSSPVAGFRVRLQAKAPRSSPIRQFSIVSNHIVHWILVATCQKRISPEAEQSYQAGRVFPEGCGVPGRDRHAFVDVDGASSGSDCTTISTKGDNEPVGHSVALPMSSPANTVSSQ